MAETLRSDPAAATGRSDAASVTPRLFAQRSHRRPPALTCSWHADGMDTRDRRHVVVTLRLPDRPGALGSVASRIGAVGADITDVTVASRQGGVAEDVFHLDLPDVADVDVVGLLLEEIAQVDGVGTPSVGDPPAGCCA